MIWVTNVLKKFREMKMVEGRSGESRGQKNTFAYLDQTFEFSVKT